MADLIAEFSDPEALLRAVERLKKEELHQLETFTPYPLRDVEEALAHPRSPIPLVCLAGGLGGCFYALLIQWWMNAFDYPLNVGGRPLDSFPAFIPSTFEGTVLAAGLSSFVALLAFSGLPRLWHPVFEVPGFERASIDRFFLRIDSQQPGFDTARVQWLLRDAKALRISEVER